MKKIVLNTSIALMLSTSAFAGKIGDYGIALEFGGLNSNAKSSVNGVSSDGDLSTSYESIKIGKYFDFGRVGASIGLMNKDKGTDGEFIGVSYDYMFYNETKLTPFIGASVSYSWNEANYDIEHNGFQYGPQAGIVYDITDKIELEAGLRYLESNVDGSKNISGNTVKIEVDNVIQYYIGIGYKF